MAAEVESQVESTVADLLICLGQEGEKDPSIKISGDPRAFLSGAPRKGQSVPRLA